MNRMCNTSWGAIGTILLLLLATAPVFAQDDKDLAAEDERDLKLLHWRWVQDLRLPEKREGAYLAVPLPSAIWGKAQDDLRDLRITDVKGTRIPYVLQDMKKKAQQTQLFPIRPEFNTGPSPKSRTYEMALEFAIVAAPGHNDIEIHTSGRNYRRRVEVFGDDSAKFDNLRPFFDKKTYVVLYDVDGRTVNVHRFRYDFKQFKFILVRLHADATADEEIPQIKSVIVRRTIIEPGEYVTENVSFGGNDRGKLPGGPGEGGPSTSWLINLGQVDEKGIPDKMPVEKLTFEVGGPPSDRPFQLYVANPGENRGLPIPASWDWRKEGDRQLLEISFPEVIARRLRFTVTDFANQPLDLRSVTATRSVQKLIIEKPNEKVALPLKLYMGNTSVFPPNYDLIQKLPIVLTPAPAVVELVELRPNPDYVPPPPTLQERMPWLVYVVLGLASLVLLAILGALAREAIRRHDETAAATSS